MKHKKMTIALIVLAILSIAIFAALQHPSFGRLPQGARLERIKQSPHFRNGKFHDLHVTPLMTSNKSKWQQLLKMAFGKKPSDIEPTEPIKAVKTNLKNLDKSEDLIVWFGHSSYLLQDGGTRILADPVLTNKFPMSLMFKPFKGTDIYSPDDIPAIDYLVISHDHWDHLDYNTVKDIKDRVGKVICPLGVGEHFEYWGYPADKIIEMDWDEYYQANDSLKIYCLPTRHFSGRFLKENPTLWASYMIDGKRRVFLGGDGGYDTHFSAIGKKFPGIELAILENGQYNQDWKYIHTLPSQLPHVIKDLGAQKVLTVHNSKFALSRHPWHEPIDSIEVQSKGQKYQLLEPKIGEICRY